MQETLRSGVLAGYPVVDVKVTLTFGSYHDVDSNENAFRMAGSMAFKEGMRRADPVLLEPMMQVEVETPEEFMGNAMGDLTSRRGMVQGMDEIAGGGGKIIRALVPLAEMYGYSTTLRSLTQGRATYTMELSTMRRYRSTFWTRLLFRKRGNLAQIGFPPARESNFSTTQTPSTSAVSTTPHTAGPYTWAPPPHSPPHVCIRNWPSESPPGTSHRRAYSDSR